MNYRLLPVLFLAAGLNGAWAQDTTDATPMPAALAAKEAAAEPEVSIKATIAEADEGTGIKVTVDASDGDQGKKPSREEVKERIKDKVAILIERAIEAKLDGSDESEEEIEQAARELEKEVESLKAGDEEINIDLSDLFGGDSDVDPSAIGSLVLIPLAGIFFTFGTPILIVGFLLYAAHRKRKMNHDMINQYLASGKEIPPEVLKGLFKETAATPKNNLHRGLSLSGIGLGLFTCFYFIAGIEVASIALIPLFIGLAQLLIWKLEGGGSGSKASAGES